MNKQIEEMAVDLCLIDTCKHLPQEDCNKTNCAYCEAEALYNAGYRKQSEGEWKIWESHIYCSQCLVVQDRATPFCPNCGARMKGGE